MTESEALKLLLQLFEDAVSAAQPAICVPPFLPDPPKGRTIVVGAGKASAAMAQALEDHWRGEHSGLVVTRYRHGAPCKKIEVVEAGHPLPDAAGEGAARRMLESVKHLSKDDLVIALMSGGGSALLTLPTAGVTLEEKRAVTTTLLKSGAPISAINTVRKHLSVIKGGRLAATAHPARVVTLAISDVPGDDPAIIASGPTVGDPSTLADARAALTEYAADPPLSVLRALADATNETVKPSDHRLAQNKTQVIASARTALEAAEKSARAFGYDVLNLGGAIEGEVRSVAAAHAKLALERKQQGWRGIILSGGELTVTVAGEGSGGRNREYALSLALVLNGTNGIAAVACDTDGIDGMDDAAGAVILPSTLARAQDLRLDAAKELAANNSGIFFEQLSDMIVTGPTRTNVNDFRAILVSPDLVV
jgi:hydroxypyruvate reductase